MVGARIPTFLDLEANSMNTRMTMVAVAAVSLAVGYALGYGQRTGFATSPAAAAEVAPHAGHVMVDEHAGHAAEAMAGGAVQAASSNPRLPAPTEGASARLDASPRHSEFVKTTANGAPLNMWVVYPERAEKAPVIVVIHGASAFDSWIRGVGDQLASEGFIAVVPDLLTGKGPSGGGTESFSGSDALGKAIQSLTRDEIIARLHAARDYGLKLPAASGRNAVLGFCFGGSQTFMYSTQQPGLHAAVVFYGSAPAQPGTPSAGPGTTPTSYTPAADMLAKITAPVLGLYGGADARINATVPATQATMKQLGKIYEPHFFEGAGHAFLSGQGGQNGANLKATEQAWPIAIGFLRRHLEGRT
jgi:carboxymethylenebutenolidase